MADSPTPGPLTVRDGVHSGCFIVGPDGGLIGEAYAVNRMGDPLPGRANALLWATAGELQEALEEAREYIAAFGDPFSSYDRELENRIDTALARTKEPGHA